MGGKVGEGFAQGNSADAELFPQGLLTRQFTGPLACGYELPHRFHSLLDK